MAAAQQESTDCAQGLGFHPQHLQGRRLARNPAESLLFRALPHLPPFALGFLGKELHFPTRLRALFFFFLPRSFPLENPLFTAESEPKAIRVSRNGKEQVFMGKASEQKPANQRPLGPGPRKP